MAARALSLWSVVIVLVASLVTGGVSIIVSSVNNTEQDQRWCSLMSTLDDAYMENPPATEPGRRVAEQIHQLRSELGCS